MSFANQSPHAFAPRHLGPSFSEETEMLSALGCSSLDDLIDQVVPQGIRLRDPLRTLPTPATESEALDELRAVFRTAPPVRSFIGQGYYQSILPPVIQRCIFENPGWYTAYTPYQAEIAQGRLEALLNFQTMVGDLTGLDIANASLLDEGTAVAEAITVCAGANGKAKKVMLSEHCHPQTIAVVRGRCEPVGIEVLVVDELAMTEDSWEMIDDSFLAVVLQYPASDGAVVDYREWIAKMKSHSNARVIMASDLLALTILESPGALGADIAVGNSQRFGIPIGNGGPHAAFFACKDELKRRMPGRLVGVSRDAEGNPALRLSLQTREQHIRREKATSNICTAQVLLAVMASMYAIYHGPERLKAIARQVHAKTRWLAEQLLAGGVIVRNLQYFDTLRVSPPSLPSESERCYRHFANGDVGISIDEATTVADLVGIVADFTGRSPSEIKFVWPALSESAWPEILDRCLPILSNPVFQKYHTETEMMRYLRRLEGKDLALNHSMIALGSCTMKLNAAAEMMPLGWSELSNVHPYLKNDLKPGYAKLIRDLEIWLADICGMDATSLQPNAGSAGEFAGLLAIRQYHLSRGDSARRICLIPSSAHGTNPASAVMAGMTVVIVKCDDQGNIDVDDLRAKAEKHSAELAALMITYPSTHGVFEEAVTDICRIVHDHGGQVYMDGANLNAQVGLTQPGLIGADVCHLNLHKTFCIPHGGGGPGVGPICCKKHLAPFLPSDPINPAENASPVSAAAFGSASILVISWMYLRMMGAEGVTAASKISILNANYLAHRLEPFYPVLYKGSQNRVAHECIIDPREFKKLAGVEVEDIAKRLMDYGFHAPTMSWPVGGTLMIEPTESETMAELDRFCDAMIAIHGEIRAIQHGEADENNNVLKNAPHTASSVIADDWTRPYSRESAAFPLKWVRDNKFWPSVARIDNVYGDKNLVCSCAPLDDYAERSDDEMVTAMH